MWETETLPTIFEVDNVRGVACFEECFDVFFDVFFVEGTFGFGL